MKAIEPEKINKILYNHQFQKNIDTLLDTFFLSEIERERHMNPIELQKKIESWGRTYPIEEVLFTMAEYVRFIVLNDSRGNYDFRRGFEFQNEMIYDKENYIRYLEYIFQYMGIPFDQNEFKQKLEKIGDSRVHSAQNEYSCFIYEFLQKSILNRVEYLKNNGIIQRSGETLELSNFDKNQYPYREIPYSKNGMEYYRDLPDNNKQLYSILQDLREIHTIRSFSETKEAYCKRLNYYTELWYCCKYARAEKVRKIPEELEEIEIRYQFAKKNKDKDCLKVIKERFSKEVKELI